jgi:hypothetical protein
MKALNFLFRKEQEFDTAQTNEKRLDSQSINKNHQKRKLETQPHQIDLAIESIVADSLIRAHMNSSIMVEGRTDVKMMDLQPHNLGHQARTG